MCFCVFTVYLSICSKTTLGIIISSSWLTRHEVNHSFVRVIFYDTSKRRESKFSLPQPAAGIWCYSSKTTGTVVFTQNNDHQPQTLSNIKYYSTYYPFMNTFSLSPQQQRQNYPYCQRSRRIVANRMMMMMTRICIVLVPSILIFSFFLPSMAYNVQHTSWFKVHQSILLRSVTSSLHVTLLPTTKLKSSRSSWNHESTTTNDCNNNTAISLFSIENDSTTSTFAYRQGYSDFKHENRTNTEWNDDTVPPIMTWRNGTDILPRLFPPPQQYRLPPFLVEDWNVLFYDLLLIINLVVSISFWVVHRMDISYIGIAFNEGCLLSLLWIVAGLFNGSFLYTAIDGHQHPNQNNNSIMKMKITMNKNMNQLVNTTDTTATDNHIKRSGGPMAAGLLALHTYINTMNLRLVYALVVAVLEHRSALSNASELLIPLEFGYGLVLMILWRTLHSSYVLR